MINTLCACTQNAQKISVDGTSDLSERKFKFLAGKIRTKTLNKKMMQKSQPTKEKEEERERHKPHSRAIDNNTHAIRIIYI